MRHPSEVAITMAAYPESIRPFERAPPPVPNGDIMIHAGDNYYDAADFKMRFPDGARHLAFGRWPHPHDGEKLIRRRERRLGGGLFRLHGSKLTVNVCLPDLNRDDIRAAGPARKPPGSAPDTRPRARYRFPAAGIRPA